MSDFLFVPIHVDAIYLTKDRRVREAMVDFSRLPFYDGGQMRDMNPDSAYISEEINSKVFQNQNLYLKKGIHLHWKLPQAFMTGTDEDAGIVFPEAPNRWLVTRNVIQNGKIQPSQQQQWIVESNYLYAEGVYAESVSFPYLPDESKNKYQTYRYMGRKWSLEDWINKSNPADEYLDGLTALGYGDPAFAAFYPNCYSIFGFYDDEIPDNSLFDIQYDVTGWYSSPEGDPLREMLKDYKGDNAAEAILEEFQWEISKNDNDITAETSTVCYAQITFSKEILKDKSDETSASGNVEIAIGQTGSEALSAYLATDIKGTDKKIVEEQLEAVLMKDVFDNNQLDVGHKFEEARFEQGFTADSAGVLWKIEMKNADEKNPADIQNEMPAVLWDPLSALNTKQRQYNKGLEVLDAMKRQTFADWYKYMMCAYPPQGIADNHLDIDEVKLFIEEQDLKPLELKISEIQSLQTEIEKIKKDIPVIIEELKNKNPATDYLLQDIEAPRYYRPAEPVILLKGEDIKVNPEYEDETALSCSLVSLSVGNSIKEILVNKKYASIQSEIKKITETGGENPPGVTAWDSHPWHPFLLEWKVSVSLLKKQTDSSGGSQKYDPDFIKDHYALNENEVVLKKASNNVSSVLQERYIYSGGSLLSPYAVSLLKTKLNDWSDNLESNGNSSFKDTMNKVKDKAKNLECLSQAFSGFNDALLMHKQTFQLFPGEPIGFKYYQDFTERVKTLVGERIINAPEPLNGFNPLRAGEMEVLSLQLIDTFGQVKELEWETVIKSETMTPPGDAEGVIALPPRFVQSARLNFRLHPAKHTEEAANYLNTTPICGWMLPNNINNSLDIYDNEGKALGSIVENKSPWQPAPGADGLADPQKIKDTCLRDTVKKITDNINRDNNSAENGFFNNFMRSLNNALKNINPENFSQNNAMALLMGRPVALVRASLSLDLKGLPAIDQDWEAFRQDMEDKKPIDKRNTQDFTKIKIPLRLGEYKQHNDGLLGFWVEEEDDHSNIFHAVQSAKGNHPYVKTHENVETLSPSFDTAPKSITMLIDPLGSVHITTGVLPVKTISIPPEQYSNAMEAIQLTFLSAPVITPAGRRNIPTPQEAGFEWWWVEKTKGNWEEKKAAQADNSDDYKTPHEIREGWLRLKPAKQVED